MSPPSRRRGRRKSDPRTEFTTGERVHDDPLVHVFDDFMTPEECAHLRQLADPGLDRAVVSSDKEGVTSDGRTNSVAWVRHETTPGARALALRVSKLVGLPLLNAESFQVIHYGPGQEYRAHYDAYDLDSDRGKRCTARGGQRLVTVLGYLSDVEVGGATGFPKLGIQVEARQGRLLVFHNCHPGTTDRHVDSLHGGLPVVAGEKWAFNLWYRVNKFQRT